MTAAQARTLVPFDVLVDSVTGGVVTVKRNRILFGVELVDDEFHSIYQYGRYEMQRWRLWKRAPGPRPQPSWITLYFRELADGDTP